MADPLGVNAVRNQRVRQRWTELDQGCPGPVQQPENERPRRAEVVDAPDPTGARPPGRVTEHGVIGPELVDHRLGVGAYHLGKAGQVVCSCSGGNRIDLHGDHFQSGAYQSHRIGADPTAQVEHSPYARRNETLGVVVGDIWAAGLLQTVSSEDHLGGRVAELRTSLMPKLGL